MSSKHRARPQRKSVRPRLEELEPRIVPTTFNESTIAGLISAIQSADSNTIVLAPGTYTLQGAATRAIQIQDNPVAAKTLLITGQTESNTVIAGGTKWVDRIFEIDGNSNLTVKLQNVTISGGNVAPTKPTATAQGGGLWIGSRNVTLSNVAVSGNKAVGAVGSGGAAGASGKNGGSGGKGGDGGEGGAARGGGFYVANGSLTLISTTFAANIATGGEGGNGGNGALGGNGNTGAPGGYGSPGGGGPIGGNGGNGGGGGNGGDGGDPGDGGNGGDGLGGGIYLAAGTLTLIQGAISNSSALGGLGGNGGAGGPGGNGGNGGDGGSGGAGGNGGNAGHAGSGGNGKGGAIFVAAGGAVSLDGTTLNGVATGGKAGTSGAVGAGGDGGQGGAAGAAGAGAFGTPSDAAGKAGDAGADGASGLDGLAAGPSSDGASAGSTIYGSAVLAPPPPAPAPTPHPSPPPALHVPPLLAFLDSVLAATETLSADGSITETAGLFGIPILVSTFNSSGDLVSVTLLGINVTALFELL